MCFSVQVNKNIKELSAYFTAGIDTQSYAQFMAYQEKEKITAVDQLKKTFGLKRKPVSEIYKTPGNDKRIYPNTFTHVMTLQNKHRVFQPMRYRVRPRGSSEEIPSKFNVFNARLDSLEKRKTWQPLFMRNHGVFAFNQFYEWVDKQVSKNEVKKSLISFIPKNREIMWAPCLWDEWISSDQEFRFKSFAIITTEPPAEIEEMGHDRCPIFLKEEFINDWLNPEHESKNEIYEMLTQQESTQFTYEWA